METDLVTTIWGVRNVTGMQWTDARKATKHPKLCRRVPPITTAKKYPSQNVSSTKVEKSWFRKKLF